MTDFPAASLKELAKYVLIAELGLRPISYLSETGLQEQEGHLYFFDFGDLGILCLISEILGKIIIFSDLEALVSFDVPSSMLDRLSKIFLNSKLLKEYSVRKIAVFGKNYEPKYLKLGDRIFELNQEVNEEELEEFSKLLEL